MCGSWLFVLVLVCDADHIHIHVHIHVAVHVDVDVERHVQRHLTFLLASRFLAFNTHYT